MFRLHTSTGWIELPFGHTALSPPERSSEESPGEPGDPPLEHSVFDYLRLLQTDDPRGALEEFLSLVETEPDVRAGSSPGSPETVTFGDLVVITEETPGSLEAFYRWWFEEFEQSLEGTTDAMTGLLSRDHWDRDRRHRLDPPVEDRPVVLVDIDHFKVINDTYGHAVGDEVLRGIGRQFRDAFPADPVVRYGGEEFLVVPESETDSIEERVEALRESIAGERYFDDQPGPITVSIGVSPSGRDTALGDRIEEADLALYESKRRGRNRTTVFAPYMKHRQQLSTWGFYRYLWDSDVRFGLHSGADRFYLYRDGELFRYAWSKNRIERLLLPDEFVRPLRQMLHDRRGLLLLDASGRLWMQDEKEGFEAIGDESAPRLIALSGDGSAAGVVGINNQFYRIDGTGLDRAGSLPGDWDDVLYDGTVYFVRDRQLMTWEQESPRTVAGLPEQPRDILVHDDRLVMSGKEGNLYQFDRELSHWKQLRVPDLFDKTIRVRSLSYRGDNYLFKDDSGRLILSRKQSKAVPQQMDLSPSD